MDDLTNLFQKSMIKERTPAQERDHLIAVCRRIQIIMTIDDQDRYSNSRYDDFQEFDELFKIYQRMLGVIPKTEKSSFIENMIERYLANPNKNLCFVYDILVAFYILLWECENNQEHPFVNKYTMIFQ